MSPGAGTWEAALDALEARLALQEAAVAANGSEGSFTAVTLPSAPLGEQDRVRAQLVLGRIRVLEAELRRRHDEMQAPQRSSPYR
jgi:hypothetical protein